MTASLFKSSGLFCLLTNLNKAVVWMGPTCPLISKSSSLSTNLLEIVLCAPIIMDITVTFMLDILLVLLQLQGIYPSFPFLFILWSARTAEYTIQQVLFFSFCC